MFIPAIDAALLAFSISSRLIFAISCVPALKLCFIDVERTFQSWNEMMSGNEIERV